MSAIAPPAPAPRRALERFLCLFADVRDGEGPQLLLLAFNVFLILTAYYVMKPVREALILAQPGGAEIKSYSYAAQALLFVVLVPLYSALATRLPRRRLINVVTALFIACLPAFYMLAQNGAPIGIVFFLWIGVFSLMVIAQFWSYANDVYSPESGKRLFAVIAFGASSGAVFGSWISSQLIRSLGVNPLLLVAVTILAISLLLFNFIDLRERAGARAREPHPDSAAALRLRDVAIGEGEAFALMMRNRYLLLIALVTFFLNWVNSAGEYILSAVVKQTADVAVASGSIDASEQGRYIGTFFADYFSVVNIVGMLLQLFLVSRAIKYLGVPLALCILPLVALASYTVAALIPSLAIIRWVKTAENSVDYSLMNTVRQLLFLPTRRNEKFKAKQAIDCFIVRAGDVLSAGTVFVGTQVLALSVSQFAWINVVLVV
ncbi:MAG: MFS transporter, partial [Betaproteobacteria bacterium]|nr:MFS transporter [Betaproteobacteria bacterium]